MELKTTTGTYRIEPDGDVYRVTASMRELERVLEMVPSFRKKIKRGKTLPARIKVQGSARKGYWLTLTDVEVQRLFRYALLGSVSSVSLPTVIDAEKIVYITDVHGHADVLTNLFVELASAGVLEGRTVVFGGDFGDRGPDTRGVLNLVTRLRETHDVAAVMGNHDLAMVCGAGWLPSAAKSNWAKRYAESTYVSEPTFRSYGADPGNYTAFTRLVPDAHRAFMCALPWLVEAPNCGDGYAFVHAGLDPDVSWADQREALLERDIRTDGRPLWLCDRTLTQEQPPEDFPYAALVTGHVQYSDVYERGKRIYGDTTGGRPSPRHPLSATLLPECEVITYAPKIAPATEALYAYA